MMMKKTILLPIVSIIVIAGIILIVILSSSKNKGQSSSVEDMILGKWVVTEAYVGDEWEWWDYIEGETESFLDSVPAITTNSDGEIWDLRKDHTFSVLNKNNPNGQILTGKWSIEDNDGLRLDCDDLFEVSNPYFDEDTNETISSISHYEIVYDCKIKDVDRNKLTIMGLCVETSWYDEIHENGDTTLATMPPSYLTSLKYSFARMK